ncbi:MAG: nucleotidyl transferase AbiEii/AbiGii toxin family protein [Candidatus Atribacteria bacterium]|nr:nucleotidyl transferase AbiEii/AbiGii toxin family protein [Candidatus Atribacteria bacterium]
MERSIQGTKEYFERFSKETNFHRDTLEKAYRLEQLLKEINRHPELREGLVLKGGTAINFLYFRYPRLSVDLDFNFIAGIGKEEKDKESHKIDEALRAIFKFKSYECENISVYGLNKYFLKYINSSGNIDRIKVEINFLQRLTLLGAEKRSFMSPFNESDLVVNTLKGPELFAGKILALIDRLAPRDLYDIYILLREKVKLDKILLKKIFIFFGCLSRSDFREYHSNDIERIEERDIKRKLLPLLRKDEPLKVGNMIQIVRAFLEEMFNFTSEELEYVNRFFKGDFKPEILFDKLLDSSIDLERHPMVIWKQRHLKDWIVRQKDK